MLQNWLVCYKFHPNGEYIEYFGAKTCEFSHFPALTQNPGCVTDYVVVYTILIYSPPPVPQSKAAR